MGLLDIRVIRVKLIIFIKNISGVRVVKIVTLRIKYPKKSIIPIRIPSPLAGYRSRFAKAEL